MNALQNSALSAPFEALLGNPALMFQLLDHFPLPFEIFAPDGYCVFVNRAFLDMNGIPDAALVLGKYNLLQDPVCDKIFGHDTIERAFRGEILFCADFAAPIQDLVNRGVTGDNKPYEAAFMDVHLFPIREGERLAYVAGVFLIKNIYKGRPEIARAKAYIDSHWLEAYDAGAVARAANVSQSHLAALFRQHTGTTVLGYYKQRKVDHIKETLADRNLSIAQAFSFCGEDSRGAFARIFKALAGMTPREYRMSLK